MNRADRCVGCAMGAHRHTTKACPDCPCDWREPPPRHDFTPAQIAEADQWLENLDGHLKQPLARVTAMLETEGRAIAFRTIARDIIRELDAGGQPAHIVAGFSYAALLLIIHDHRKASQ